MPSGAGQLPMTTLSVAHIAVLITAGLGCGWDVRTRRIPNVVTFGAAAAALLFYTITGGVSGLTFSAAGWLVASVLLCGSFLLGGMGAGDVKLIGALGAWLGPVEALWLAVFTGIAGGIAALLVAVSRGYLSQACRNIGVLLMHWRAVGLRPAPQLTLATSQGPRLAYAVPMLGATIAIVWLR